ncbi:MAG: LCP family protein [Anaeromicrobium sp.]|uniref:LCP family protein n=1 Tax=Anaeromicrobium sp. TaxID=1929132 RepID=UPI0025DF1900|nr:LCP family protein [Anaeromicrobium sp.]MCT4594033.1 LCP family protein [Anaeromicrobium sp.]
MKTFMKVFFIGFLCFTIVMGAGVWAFTKFYNPPEEIVVQEPKEEVKEKEVPKEDPKSELELLIEKSDRINFLLLGMEGPRTDTIMFASFDPDTNNIDLVSVPRDTYYERNKNHSPDKKKINAVHGDEGVTGTKTAISKVLCNVPIDYYIKVRYEGVESVVDSLGGVKVTIPIDMKYDDPYDKPPLHIDLRKGTQVLDGKKAIQFLRFRKGNDGKGYPNGDLGRTKAQQQFIKAALRRALGFRLPVVANTVMKYIDTDLSVVDGVKLATDAIGMNSDSLKTYSMPGDTVMRNRLSYFIHDKSGAEDIIKEIYSR